MNFARHKFIWLDQVLADPEIGDFAIRLALVLMTYINGQSGEAWPSHETLAARCRASRRGVQKALDQLRDRGHLLIEVVRGRTHTNRYRLNAKMAQPELPLSEFENANRRAHFNDAKMRTAVPENANHRSVKCEPPFAQNLFRNSKKNTDVGKASSEAAKTSPKKTAYPEPFETFWRLYPTDQGMSKLEAYKQWDRLAADDREKALRGIPGFKAWIAKQGSDYRTVHACRYISQRRFDSFGAANGPEATWDHAKYKAVIPLVKQRRAWSPAYPPPSTIPRDLIDDELLEIIATHQGGKA